MEKAKIKDLAKWLDDRLPFNEWIGGIVGMAAEFADGRVFVGLFEYALERVDPEYHDEIEVFVDGILNGNFEAIKEISTERLVEIIKSPLGDEREKVIIGAQLDMIFGLFEIERKKMQEAE